MFYHGSNMTQGTSTYKPENLLTPSALYDFSDETVQKWMEVMDRIDALNTDNLLIVTLGTDISTPSNLFANLLREPTKTIFQKYITENPTQFMGLSVFPSDEHKQTYEIRESEPFVDTSHNNILLSLDGLFPLTPIYGPHPFYGNGNYQSEKNTGYCNTCSRTPKTRRILFSNNIKILNRFVNYAGPLILDSGINDICYRSLLYIADKRKTLNKETHVICGYTSKHSVKSYTPGNLFPRPFEKCRSYITTPTAYAKYYSYPGAKLDQTKINKAYNRTIAQANKYANNLLEAQY
jgi:hypothetical protein